MHQHYIDIISKIAEPPQWFDEHAVPRYCEFHPSAVADIYADEVVLYLIKCQGCGQEFKVAESLSAIKRIYHPEYGIADVIKSHNLHYGDPPNVGCCGSGPTMNCEDIITLQYWHKVNFAWVRDESLENILQEDA